MAARRKPRPKQLERFDSRRDVSHDAWFDLPESEMGAEIETMLRDFKTQQAGRRTRYIRNLELYEGRSMSGYSGYSYCEDGPAPYERERLRLIRSAVSSAVANIYAPQKPKPQFQTLGATWAQRRKAYKLDKICEGIINQRQGRWINVWSMMIDAGVEAVLQGCAAIMVTANKAQKRIDHSLIPVCDVFTDPAQGRTPTDFFCRLPIAVDDAIEQYAGKSSELKRAIRGAKDYDWYGSHDRRQPRAVRVVEINFAWHMPAAKDKPGKWGAQIGGVLMDGGDWTAPAPPFVFLQWEPWRDGFWASGVGDEGGSMSEEIDNLDQRLYLREVIASGLKVFYPQESLKPDELSANDPVSYIPYMGNAPPTPMAMVPFAASELEYLKYRVQTFWDALGLSQVSAAARREPGIESGVAIQTLNDTKSGRQLVKGQRYEQSYVDLSHQYVWRLRELADEDPEFAVTWSGKSLIRSYKWKDADVEDDAFTTTVAPASAFPHDPAGRLDYVQAMYKGGLVSQETAKQLMNWPDLESEMSMENAETEYLDMLIERYLDAEDGQFDALDYQPPEAFIINKVGAIRRFASSWFRARIDQATLPEEERQAAEFSIQLIARWIKEMDMLMNPPPPPGAPGPVPPGPMPGGPMAPVPPGVAAAGMLPPNGAPMPGALPPAPPVPPPQPGI
ncbi:MAG TPA: hypothetical protein VGK73_06685 [Polyangiaceae bacterium]